MSRELLTLAEAQETIRALCDPARVAFSAVQSVSENWTEPHAAADHFIGWADETNLARRDAVLGIAAALRAYARHLDYRAGAEAERANAVAVLRDEAAWFDAQESETMAVEHRNDSETRKGELRYMADRIARGERAEGH